MGYKKWLSCKNSIALGYRDEASHELREEGYTEMHGCLCPKVIETSNFTMARIIENEVVIPVAVLFGTAKSSDPELINVLSVNCGGCRWFEKR